MNGWTYGSFHAPIRMESIDFLLGMQYMADLLVDSGLISDLDVQILQRSIDSDINDLLIKMDADINPKNKTQTRLNEYQEQKQ